LVKGTLKQGTTVSLYTLHHSFSAINLSLVDKWERKEVDVNNLAAPSANPHASFVEILQSFLALLVAESKLRLSGP
jgi:hypothetical protein